MVHRKLLKYRWYKSWHAKPYANAIHNLMVIGCMVLNLYLALKLNALIHQAY